MAPSTTTITTRADSKTPYQLDAAQTLRATSALQRKIQSDQLAVKSSDAANGKASLLADADSEDDEHAVGDDVPVWLILTTKKHIADKKRLKPGKIALPHPYLDVHGSSSGEQDLRICLITADPQRRYKDLLAAPGFPAALAQKVTRIIGVTKLKAKYKSYESRRQLAGEYDVFLADDRIVTYLPAVLGKVFYKGGAKRPVPVTLEGRRESVDAAGSKRRKLSEGGSKVVKQEAAPADVGREIERALGSALVHLAPSATTAVKVGVARQTPQQLRDNVEAVVQALVDKFVPQKWRNVRAVHIKGPETAALPIWLTDELWEKEEDVLDEPLPVKDGKKRKRGALAADAAGDGEKAVIEVPGPDGKMRRLEAPPAAKAKSSGAAAEEKPKSKKSKNVAKDEVALKAQEKSEKEARKSALKKQKDAAKAAGSGKPVVGETKAAVNGDGKKSKKRAVAADLI